MKNIHWLIAVTLAALFVPSVLAQGTFATITGSVTDPSGAAVPAATIEATHLATNYVYTVQSNEAGQYTLANLREGVYTLKATAEGFQEFVVTSIELAGRDLRRVDVNLQVGEVATTVEVVGGATLIETEVARVSDVKTGEVLRSLPLSLRRMADYYQLSPQVSKPRGAWYIRFAGSRAKQGEVVVDGGSMADLFGGPSTGVTNDRTESWQELRIDMAGNSAEYAGIGQLSAVTKSGSNDLHGSAFYYYATPGLQARNPFSTQSTASLEHVPGGSVGGPVYIPKVYDGRNKTFFFASIEFERLGSPNVTLMNPTVPLAAWRKGDFSKLLPATVVKDPFGGNAPFPGNVIPSSRLNPVSMKLQDRFYPLPNYGPADTLISQNYREIKLTDKTPNPTLVLRFDHRFGDKAFVYWRLTKTDWNIDAWQGGLPTIGLAKRRRYSRGSAVAYTHTLRPSLLSEFRWGYASDSIPSIGPIQGKQLVSELGLTGLAPGLPDVSGLFNFNFTGLGLSGVSGGDYCNPCSHRYKHSFDEHLTWFRGRHSMKFGFRVAYGRWEDNREEAGLFGNHTFSNRFTGYPYGDFLLGIPTTARRQFPTVTQDATGMDYAGFYTDEYKLRSDLTLTYGVRYEYKAGFTAKDGLQAIFDIGSGKIVVPDGALGRVNPLMPTGYVDVIEASTAGLPSKKLIRGDTNNFAPRIGLAWRPSGSTDTVFRAGYGIYYDIAARNASWSGVPFKITEPAFTNPAGSPTVILPLVFPSTGVGGPSTVGLPGAINPDIKIPYSMQYTATVEHQRWDTGFRATYTGTNTRQGVWGYDINSPVPDSRPYIEKPRMFPKYPAINYMTNGAGHQYHALTLEAERRMKDGLHFQTYFTWARDIGDLEDGEIAENAYDRRRERAVWADIPTYRFNANVLYEFPIGKGKKLLSNVGSVADAFVGGWRLNNIYVYDSGFFLTPLWSGPDPTGTRYTTSKTAPNVTIRPDALFDPNLDNPTTTQWFNPAAFAAPQKGSFGTAAKGLIKGPASNVLHTSMSKFFDIKERARLRLEFLATNILNHPNYRDPGLNISQAAQVGVISNVVNRNTKLDMAIPRVVQLIVRLEW